MTDLREDLPVENNIAETILNHYEEFLGNHTGAKLYKFGQGASMF